MRRLLGFLLRPEISLWRYCLYAWPLDVIPSIGFYLAARFTVEAFGLNASAYSAPARDVTLGSVFGGVVFAPVVETLLLAGILRLLSFTSRTPALVAAVSAVLWGGLSCAVWGALVLRHRVGLLCFLVRIFGLAPYLVQARILGGGRATRTGELNCLSHGLGRLKCVPIPHTGCNSLKAGGGV